MSDTSRRPRHGPKSVSALVGEGMVARTILVPAREVVFVKGIIDAHEGLAQVFSDAGGELTLASPACRARELERLVADLVREFGALLMGGNSWNKHTS